MIVLSLGLVTLTGVSLRAWVGLGEGKFYSVERVKGQQLLFLLDLVYRVHLKGSFMVTRAAFEYMKKQKYGR